ncbi:MAG: tRNA-dihydrouridine synthase [Bdellovibrionota bacterium]
MTLKFDNPFILAPMAGITDMPFRRLMRKMGTGAVISEFVSAHAIKNNSPKLKKYLAYHEDERPVGIQLFGGEDEILAHAAQIVEGVGVDFVDINLGCPVPKVTKKGGGSAWLCHPVDLGKMLALVKSRIQIPLTIKIRTGWDDSSKNALEIVKIAHNEGIAAVAIHGRTRAQGYSGQPDWDFISEIASESKVPIIGNGDIITGPLAAARLRTSGCAAVMIGRGALKNPWIFQEAVEALTLADALSPDQQKNLFATVLQKHELPETGTLPAGRDYFHRKVKKLQPKPTEYVSDWVKIRADRNAQELIDLHLSLLRETYPEERAEFAFRKFLAWYAAGYPGAKEFRKFVFTTEEFPRIVERTVQFFEGVKLLGAKGEEQRENDPLFSSGHG